MFPTILKNLRKKNKVTQIQLATAIGVSPGNVGDWETGKSFPSYNALISLAKYFDVSADTLLELEPPKEPIMTDYERDLLKMICAMDDRDRTEIYDLVELKYHRNYK